jgi:UPF0271 protein
MRRTARLAAQYGIAIGAHPGFPDPHHFGRTERNVSPQDVVSLMGNQIKTLADLLSRDRLALTHVKPHGALYNMAGRDPEIARAVVNAVKTVDHTLALYALAGSVLANEAQAAGLTVVHEAFADRAYRADGSLVPRSEQRALLQSEEDVRRQLRQLMKGGVTSIEGPRVVIRADSLCLHADTPHAVSLARMIRHELESAGIRVAGVRDEHV